MTVKDLLEMLRPHETATEQGAKVLVLTAQLERFSFGTPVKNPPTDVTAALKYATAKMTDGVIVLE